MLVVFRDLNNFSLSPFMLLTIISTARNYDLNVSQFIIDSVEFINNV